MVDANEYLKKGYRMDNGNLVTPEFRASYVFLFTARANKKGKNPKHSVNCLFPVGTDLTLLKKACEDVMIKKFGVDRANWPASFKHPFKSQTDRFGKDKGYEKDGIYIIPNSNNRPGIVDAAVKPIINPSDVYSGCWGVAMIRPYWYDNEQKGVGFELVNFQKTRDDEPFGNRSTPESGFQAVGSGSSGANGFTPQSSGGGVSDPFATQPTGAPSDIFK